MPGLPRRNEDRFYRYPWKRIVAILQDEQHLNGALRELERVGVDIPHVNVLSGPAGARLLDKSGTGHGIRARLLRLLQGGAYESDVARTHERALNNGQHVIYVPVRDRKEGSRVADVLRAAGGRYLIYFGTWSISQLPA
jgi:hypothetical protein